TAQVALWWVAVVAAVALMRAPSAAQMIMMAPIEAHYRVGGFDYLPPAGEGWRQVGSAPNEVHLVYAEVPEAEKVDFRLDLVIHAFDVEDPAAVPDAASLARISHQQQAAKRKGALVALSDVVPVAGGQQLYTFTLVTRAPEGDVFESFYVGLAPDRSQYVVAKATTDDPAYEHAPFWQPLQESIVTLRYRKDSGEETNDESGGEKKAESPSGVHSSADLTE
ncbi:MAG: hypothetical protein D6760_09445, partial [Deltaproteobacteria bacterium]